MIQACAIFSLHAAVNMLYSAFCDSMISFSILTNDCSDLDPEGRAHRRRSSLVQLTIHTTGLMTVDKFKCYIFHIPYFLFSNFHFFKQRSSYRIMLNLAVVILGELKCIDQFSHYKQNLFQIGTQQIMKPSIVDPKACFSICNPRYLH
jgi:hypothetical protein